MLRYQSYNKYRGSIVNESKKNKKRSLLFDRVQTKEEIGDFRKYINKNVNIYHIDAHKRTILMFTAQNYHFEVFKYLVASYPKLLTYQDDKDMNIMHYVAQSRIDDELLVQLITNKKYTYNKLIWCRDINGKLPKDISKQFDNKQITKSFEKIMHDTWEQYHHIARNNNNIILPQNQTKLTNNINSDDIYSEDMDMDNNDNRDNKIEIEIEIETESKQPPLNIPNISNIPYRSIVICSRKRQREGIRIENDDFENYYPSLPDKTLTDVNNNDVNSNKRRKLNSNGTYLRTTPSQPEISPSPLPPLPPIQLTPFQLNSYNNLNNNNYLSLNNNRNLIHRNKIINTMPNISSLCEMEEIKKLYYNGETITKQQFMFVKWYKKCIGNMSYLSVIINKGYDNINKFMKLNKQFDSQIDINRFSNRIRDLQLSPLSNNSISNNSESINQSMRDLSIEEKIISVNGRNHLISDSVINSSDSTSCDCFLQNDNKIISFPWACAQCDASEDDDL
eukprot:437064_1